MRLSPRGILIAALLSVASALKFDLSSFDPKTLINKLRDTMEMLMGMLWVTGASPQCAKSLKRLIRDLFDGKIWALYVVDATAKPEPGILEGAFSSVGSQTECLKARAFLNISGRDSLQKPWHLGAVQGSFCKIRYRIGLREMLSALEESRASANMLDIVDSILGEDRYLLGEIENVVEEFPGFFGMCVPSSCSEKDVQSIFNFIAPILRTLTNVTITVQVTGCKTREQVDAINWTPSFLVALVLLGVILLFMALGTLLSVIDSVKPAHNHGKPEAGSCVGDLLRCFSVPRNVRRLLSRADEHGAMACVAGLRALSAIWLLMGHFLLLHSMALTKNLTLLKDKVKDITIQFIINFTPAGDTIICLVLTPLMVLTTVVVAPLFPQSGQGPTWELETGRLVAQCSSNWWFNVLHINNFLPRKQQCLEHTWLFAILMQFTVVGVLLIPVFYHRPVVGRVLSVSGIVASMALTFLLTLLHDLGPTWMFREYKPGTRNTYTEMVYIRPYTRASVFLMGMIVGELLSHRKKITLHKGLVCLSWICSLSTLLALIHATFKWNRGLELPGTEASAAYGAFSRVLWAAAVCWVVVSCAHGYGGWLNSLLSLKCWQPLSRLLYCLYIVSPFVITYSNGVREHAYFLSYDAMSYVLLHHMVLTVVAAAVFSLCLELPFLRLEEMVADRLAARRAAAAEPMVAVPHIEPHWLDKGGHENPAFAKEKL
ncbi:nose resistant to fluoxetine protein 6-like [Haemaphysalis longicornis]